MKKNSIFTLLFIIILELNISSAIKHPSILEFYNLFTHWKNKNDAMQIYQYETINNKTIDWKMKNAHAYRILVDLPNGYLEYNMGCSCHSVHYSYAIFTTSSDDVYLSFGSDELKFYKYLDNGTWVDATNLIVPNIYFESFMDEKNIQLISDKLKKNIKINFQIPRHGTDIIATIQLYTKHDNVFDTEYKSKKSLNVFKPEFDKTFKYKKITFTWDINQAKVSMSKKE